MTKIVLVLGVALALTGCNKKSQETAAAPAPAVAPASEMDVSKLEAAHPGLVLKPTPAQIAAATPLHNPICPTDGQKNGEMGKPVQVIYKGKVVDLCCPGCPAEFGADPDKYLALAEAGKGP